jgi:hypothetical protein
VIANAGTAPAGRATAPVAKRIIIPPLDGVPPAQAGALLQIDLLVDEHGVVIADSTRIAPAITSPRYDRKLRTTLARYEFYPAVLDGCAVPGRIRLELGLPQRR